MWEAMQSGCEKELAVRLGLGSNGAEHPSSLKALHKLAWANYNLGSIKITQEQTQRALEARRRVLGPERADTLRTLNNLALITTDECLSTEALEGPQKTLGDHEYTVEGLSNHSIILNDKGENESALGFNDEAIAMMRKLYPPKHPDILQCLRVRLNILYELERFKEAEKLAREILEVRKSVSGPSHIDTIFNLEDCACACSCIGDYANAEKYVARCLESCYKYPGLGPNYPKTWGLMQQLGDSQKMQNKFAEAQKTYEAVLFKVVETFGKEHEETWPYPISLCSLFLMTGDENKALGVLGSFIEMAKSKGIQDDYLLDDVAELANSLQKINRWEEAELIWEIVVFSCKNSATRGRGHDSTVRAINSLCSVLQARQKLSEAEKKLRVEYQSRKEIWGPAHEYSLFTCRTLIEVLKRQGKLPEAENFRQEESRLFTTRESELEKQHNLHLLGQQLYQARTYEEAEKIVHEILDSGAEMIGYEDPVMEKATNLLNEIRSQQDKAPEVEE